jgi:hypothetical protein
MTLPSEAPYLVGESVDWVHHLVDTADAPVVAAALTCVVTRPDRTTFPVTLAASAVVGEYTGTLVTDMAGIWQIRTTCPSPRIALERVFRVVAPYYP